MSAKLEIVLEDHGATAEQVVNGTGPARPQAPPRADGDRVQGPRARSTGGDSPAAEFGKAADTVAKALGFGPLAAQAKELGHAFQQMYSAVTRNTQRAADGSMRPPSGTGSPVEFKSPAPHPDHWQPVGPTAAAAPPVVGPAPPPVAMPPVAPPIAGPGARLVGPPAAAATAGAQAAPAVAGPAAAGGATAAATMGRLAAAAGPAALAVAALGAAVIGGVVAVKKLSDGLNAEGDRLARFSGEITGAQANKGVREEFADIRRADRIGPQLAGVMEASSQIQAKIADVNTELLKFVVDLVNDLKPVLPVVVNSLGVVATGIPVGIDFFRAIYELATGKLEEATTIDEQERKTFERFSQAVARLALNARDEEIGEDPAISAFLQLAMESGAVAAPQQDRRNALADHPLNQARIRARNQRRGGA